MNSTMPYSIPTKPLIVADTSKLSYFAKANMVRAGLNAGRALNGLGVVAADAPNASGSQSTGSFFTELGRMIGGAIGAVVPGAKQTPPSTTVVAKDDTVLGLPPAVAAVGGIVLGAGLIYVVYKAVK